MTDTAFPSAKAAASIRRHQPLVAVVVALAVGIVFDRFFPLPVFGWVVGGAIGWIAWLLLYLLGRTRGASFCLLVCIAAMGAGWHHCRWCLFGHDDLGFAARSEPQPICVRGIVVGGPRFTPAFERDPLSVIDQGAQTRLTLRVTSVRDGLEWRSASGRARVIVHGQLLGVHAGDCVQLFGRLAAPREPANPGDFDAAAYHRRQRRLSILLVGKPDGVARLRKGAPWAPLRIIERIRNYFENQLEEHVTWAPTSLARLILFNDDEHLDRDAHQQEGQSPLAMAILLGGRERLHKDERDAFLATGTLHLMAISGLHVSILVGLFLVISRVGLMRQGWALATIMVVTVIYALLTDARPSVVRATILTWMMCLAWFMGREPFSFNTLAAAAIVVLGLNPSDLFHAGAQLSFLAVGTLSGTAAFFTDDRSDDPLRRLITESQSVPVQLLQRGLRWIGKLALASLLVWTVAIPLVAYHFNIFSPVAVVLTPVLWIPVTILLYCGFGVLIFSWPVPPVAWLLGRVCDRALWLLDACVNTAQEIPGSHFWIPAPPIWAVLGFYAWLILPVVCPALRPPRKWYLGILAGWFLVGAGSPWLQDYLSDRHSDRLTCTFMSVGHGTSVLLELPGGESILYDAGGLGSPRASAESISAVLWSRGIRHLDGLVLSHADTDHYNAVPRLLGRFSVEALYVSPQMFPPENTARTGLETADVHEDDEGAAPRPATALQCLRDAASSANVPVRRLFRGKELPCRGPARLEVLHPPRLGVNGSDNANSIVLLVEFGGRRILLPGDLDGAGMDAVFQEAPIDVDVLMAPHHGRPMAKCKELLQWSTPEKIVISGGAESDPGQVERQFAGSGRQLHRTEISGAVTVTIDRDDIRVEAFRPYRADRAIGRHDRAGWVGVADRHIALGDGHNFESCDSARFHAGRRPHENAHGIHRGRLWLNIMSGTGQRGISFLF